MKNQNRKKYKFLFSLLICLLVAGTGLSAYAIATGRMPQILNAVASVFVPSAAGASSKAQIADLQIASSSQSTVSDPDINPSEINPTDSIAHNDSSSSVSSADPDAKVDNTPISNRGDTNVEPLPITVTPVATSKPVKPATNTSSKAPTTPKPSTPASSAPSSSSSSPVSSSPSRSPSGGSTGGSYSNPITGVSIDKTTLKLNKGETSEPLKATITPSGATGDKTITWKSDNKAIVTIDQTGKVTAIGPGTTQVEANTANGKVALCTVTVLVPPTSIKINSDNFSIDKDSSKTLTATLEPTDCTDAGVVWATSNSDVAAIDSTGKVTGIAAGKATITVSTQDGKLSASCELTVVVSISSLTLDQADLTLIKGSQATLTATIIPPDTTEDKTIQWSSTNPAAATVDSNGLITAVEGGTTTITAQAGSHFAECKVAVIVPVTGIEMTEHSVTIAKGTDKTLSVKITPDDATDKLVTWASSDEKVATVDSSGKVTAVSVGSAVITATTHDGGYSVQCNLSVVIPVTGVTLDKQSLTVIKGNTDTLHAAITPADATDQAVTWKSSNPAVATIDSSGKVSAVAGGSSTISVTTNDGGFTAECTVTVTVPVTSISLNKTSDVILFGNSDTLSAVIAPSDATNKNIIWTSSDSLIATVDATGKVTATGYGNAIITATTVDGGFTSTCNINTFPVTYTSYDVSPIGVSGGTLYYNCGRISTSGTPLAELYTGVHLKLPMQIEFSSTQPSVTMTAHTWCENNNNPSYAVHFGSGYPNEYQYYQDSEFSSYTYVTNVPSSIQYRANTLNNKATDVWIYMTTPYNSSAGLYVSNLKFYTADGKTIDVMPLLVKG